MTTERGGLRWWQPDETAQNAGTMLAWLGIVLAGVAIGFVICVALALGLRALGVWLS